MMFDLEAADKVNGAGAAPAVAAPGSADDQALEERSAGSAHMPGELGIWLFIAGDMVVFGMFFLTFLFYRRESAEVYAQSHLLMSSGFGLLNTALLLTSSLLVAIGVNSIRNGRASAAARCIMLAWGCGLGFIVSKFFEYSEKIAAGITIGTNEFFMFYYMYTGIHLLHVVIGMGVLLLMWRACRQQNQQAGITTLESGGVFWHMVDLLWIVLFTLFYVIG